MINSSPHRWLGILLVAGCGVAGYAAGGGWDGAGKKAVLTKIRTFHQPQTAPRARGAQMDEFRGFEELLTGSRETEIWKVISQLPTARIPEALLRLRELQAAAASRSSKARWLDEIESAVYFRWAESDPAAALADVASIPESTNMAAKIRRSLLITSVLAAWMRTDPNAAYRAVKDDEKLEYFGRDLLVKTWTSENVFENLKLYPENHGLLLGWYCGAVAEDPARRAATLQALKEQPEMQDRDWGYSLLFRCWGYQDFDAAMAEAQTRKLPEMTKQLLQDNVALSPQKVMPWAVKNNIPPGGPQWEEGYSHWLKVDRPAAAQWFASQAASWESDGHSDAVAGFLAQDLANARMTKQADDQLAAAGKLTELMARWQNKDPQAAGKWLDTAPQAARDLFSGKGAAQ